MTPRIGTGGAVAIGIAVAISGAIACNHDDAWRPPRMPADIARRPAPQDRDAATLGTEAADAGLDSGPTDAPDGGSGAGTAKSERRSPPSPSIAEPIFGAEPVKPGDPHAFRLAVALKTARATRSGANVLKMFSIMPDVIDMKRKTGVDAFAEGEWLLVYGSRTMVPGPNANVVKHATSESEITRATTAAGITGDGHVRLFGVRDTLIRPQPGILALVPNDRATELGAALAKPIDTLLKPGELARTFIAEPSKVVSLPGHLVRANVIVKAASDGGLDATAVADCPDAPSCTATATALEEIVKRQNSIALRIALGNILGSFAVKANGAKLEASLHASPDQVESVLQLLRAMMGLPAADPNDAKH